MCGYKTPTMVQERKYFETKGHTMWWSLLRLWQPKGKVTAKIGDPNNGPPFSHHYVSFTTPPPHMMCQAITLTEMVTFPLKSTVGIMEKTKRIHPR